jgi:hypothetical protein
MQNTKTVLTMACIVALAAPLTASENTTPRPNAGSTPGIASMSGSGGTLTAARQTGHSITVTGVKLSGTTGSATFACTITGFGAGTYEWKWICPSFTLKINSAVVISGKFTTNVTFPNPTMTLTASGGGRGGNVHDTYNLSGKFTGSLKQGSATRPVSGSLSIQATTKQCCGAPGNVIHFTLN